MSYWDTSTLGKLYLSEADSLGFAQKAADATVIITAKLALHEMRRVVFRIRTFDAIHLATARATGEIEVVVTDQRMRDAAKLFGFALFPA